MKGALLWVFMYGGPGRTRTSDQWIMSPLTKPLYPTITTFIAYNY